MDDALAKVVGPLEAEVLRVLWTEAPPLGVRDVLERMNAGRRKPLAYTTVMTVMARLADKQILRRRLEGRGYVYEPAVRDAAEIAVQGVVRDFGDAALAHFVDEARGNPALRRRLERLLDRRSET